MGHISVYHRMLVWGIGTLMAIVGAVRIAPGIFGYPTDAGIIEVLLFLGGLVIIIINEVVFGLRKTQLEIDRDETIKRTAGKHPHSPMILAICPQCKSRIPSDSKYCLECGTDLTRQTPYQA